MSANEATIDVARHAAIDTAIDVTLGATSDVTTDEASSAAFDAAIVVTIDTVIDAAIDPVIDAARDARDLTRLVVRVSTGSSHLALVMKPTLVTYFALVIDLNSHLFSLVSVYFETREKCRK